MTACGVSRRTEISLIAETCALNAVRRQGFKQQGVERDAVRLIQPLQQIGFGIVVAQEADQFGSANRKNGFAGIHRFVKRTQHMPVPPKATITSASCIKA